MSIVRNIKRQNYVIPDSLTYASNVVTATFGTVNYNVTLSGLTANGLYFLYLKGSTPSLNFSTLTPSQYRASFTDAILVGAFYSTAATTPVWGSFVNIVGEPSTVTEINESGSAQLVSAFQGFSAVTLSSYNWSRVGRNLFVSYRLDSVTGTASTAGFPLPRGGLTSVENSYSVGTYSGQNGSANALGGHMLGAGSTVLNFGNNLTSGTSISVATGNTIVGTAPSTMNGQFRVFISQWSSTPLVDL